MVFSLPSVLGRGEEKKQEREKAKKKVVPIFFPERSIFTGCARCCFLAAAALFLLPFLFLSPLASVPL